jgi:hypothetical protein
MKKINVTLNRIEGDDGILITSDKKEIQIPTNELPSKKQGESFSIEVKSEEEAEASEEKLAKTILNEILKGE